ncbi:hybrid sensor histidine kinase/response regulator [Scytonema millei]|uniref:histidine kinase n=1 Tax=Scytonema millei VB511283 TaxID=1245923 RepID=A0A9X5E1U6_9CYAN|nr:ATP-binding protein [Scytonema millei]NHC33776.1 response regulator [Scytonema millei VB511283]
MNGNEKSQATDWLNSSGEMGKLIRSKDWSKTPLGPIASWSQSLRTTVSLCLASNFPINIIWGPGRVQIYNDGYWLICGDKHPHSMGQDYKECWLSAWDAIGEPYERATAGETAFLENRRMFLDRNGYLEETFFTFSLSPIRDETGGVGGLFHPVTEMTQQILAERRLRVLRDVTDYTADAKTIEEACRSIAQALAAHELDLPFTLFYQLNANGKQADLMSVTGLELESALCPKTVDLEASPELWALAEVAQLSPTVQGASGQTRQIDELEQRFGAFKCSPYPETPKSAIVVPIALPGLEHPWGVFAVGVSPRRALDEAYQTFYTLLGKSVITTLTNARAYEEERKRVEALAELDRAKTTFFSNVSHEFRTPLTLLLAPLQDALSDRTYPLDPVHRVRLELAHRNSLRLMKLVNTLLDFSRIEAGRMEAVYEPTDLSMFTAELASVFRSTIERSGLRLVVDCTPIGDPVYVDRQMWEKIVLNLLSNAFKFTLEGEIAVRLLKIDDDGREANRLRHRVMLQIQDTGIGIEPEELPHLFERFYQVRGAKARTHEGSGIGLALVQELIKLHGGTVEVSSTPRVGSCFTVTIPLGTAHLPSDRIQATRTIASTALGAAPYVQEAERWLPQEEGEIGGGREGGMNGCSPTLPQPYSPTPSRILLVDDNADMRDYLKRIFSEQNLEVEAVADGAAALVAARAQVPDLVLSDVMMPHLDGFGLLQALRADPQTREIPIILLSARAGEESVVSGLEAGADDYLIKPFSAAELVSRVNAHLQMAQLRRIALSQEREIGRRKDELLSTVSHELNTPLVAILGWTRLLRSSPTNHSMLMKSLDTIERNATLQAKLIQDLLDMSRISAGKLRLSLQPVELKLVIENAIAAVLTAAIAKDIHLQWKPSVREPHIIVLGDGDRLGQVICNLLTNAIKFTPDSGSVTVELSAIDEDGNYPHASYAQIRVMDTGIGIAAEFLPHVFDRLSQAEGSNSAKGLGLGLAIARHLVELHNGTIHAASLGVGQGATFTVKLPILPEW